MHYRPLGNTGLRVSVIGLGGHWRTADGRRYHDTFADDHVPTEVIKNRTEVLSAALDAGINYLDITTGAECLAYGQALAGRRDRFLVGADDYQWGARNPACLNTESLMTNVERCLTRLRTDYLDIWRVISETRGRNTQNDLDTVIEAADQLIQQGKVRHLGLSAHDPGWVRSLVEQHHRFEVYLVPCTPGSRPSESARPLLELMAEHRAGIIGIKPFSGGQVFRASGTDGIPGDTDRRLAALILRRSLCRHPQLSCLVPGFTTTAELVDAAKAVADLAPLSADEADWLDRVLGERTCNLPADYRWLSGWDQV